MESFRSYKSQFGSMVLYLANGSQSGTKPPELVPNRQNTLFSASH